MSSKRHIRRNSFCGNNLCRVQKATLLSYQETHPSQKCLRRGLSLGSFFTSTIHTYTIYLYIAVRRFLENLLSCCKHGVKPSARRKSKILLYLRLPPTSRQGRFSFHPAYVLVWCKVFLITQNRVSRVSHCLYLFHHFYLVFHPSLLFFSRLGQVPERRFEAVPGFGGAISLAVDPLAEWYLPRHRR